MDLVLRDKFSASWNKFFNDEELPVAVWYSDSPETARQVSPEGHHCMIAQFRYARQGEHICFGKGSIACGGGNRYCGFSPRLRPNFEYFLSYGKENMEGERYKKDPELVNRWLLNNPPFEAPGKFLHVKPWDKLGEQDEPFAVIFFAKPDVLSGLFTLANYDEEGSNGVQTPMGAGCMSIINVPLFENEKENPAAFIGLFDISARPSIGANELSFAVPMKRFKRMINYMDESFLITESWKKLRKMADRV